MTVNWTWRIKPCQSKCLHCVTALYLIVTMRPQHFFSKAEWKLITFIMKKDKNLEVDQCHWIFNTMLLHTLEEMTIYDIWMEIYIPKLLVFWKLSLIFWKLQSTRTGECLSCDQESNIQVSGWWRSHVLSQPARQHSSVRTLLSFYQTRDIE